ncbi:hypothetical protein NPIL_130961 [Nephila pilipes]|uniref:Uncharacterized protein n=1 Tax=Nephila pilipes TaxID=299642 RepID=A0A8X6PR56_NEPPI|nr:hypothetical protein NPIL_130961 [Nephila pilipes]
MTPTHLTNNSVISHDLNYDPKYAETTHGILQTNLQEKKKRRKKRTNSPTNRLDPEKRENCHRTSQLSVKVSIYVMLTFKRIFIANLCRIDQRGRVWPKNTQKAVAEVE